MPEGWDCANLFSTSFFDFICVSGTLEGRMIEFADHLHEHFLFPVEVKNGTYILPKTPGFCGEMKPESVAMYEFLSGPVWQEILKPKV